MENFVGTLLLFKLSIFRDWHFCYPYSVCKKPKLGVAKVQNYNPFIRPYIMAINIWNTNLCMDICICISCISPVLMTLYDIVSWLDLLKKKQIVVCRHVATYKWSWQHKASRCNCCIRYVMIVWSYYLLQLLQKYLQAYNRHYRQLLNNSSCLHSIRVTK